MKTALLVIDVQMALAHDDEAGAERSCPDAGNNISTLLQTFRDLDGTVIHIHHHGLDADDPFNAEAPGAAVQPLAAPAVGEAVYIKNVSSSFIGTTLEKDLRADNIERLVLCGATANHCVETTTRMAGNLGFDAIYVSDAVWAYAATGPDGVTHSAEQIHSISLANIEGEFATVLSTEQVLALGIQ
ncbi:isochorismatase family protein [Roseibium sp. SCP14]|uniref:isochorismatase family protein n=1 Tax=Roseibium sp. SCP14 TaxID=3141375 RepID=UPI003335EBB7